MSEWGQMEVLRQLAWRSWALVAYAVLASWLVIAHLAPNAVTTNIVVVSVAVAIEELGAGIVTWKRIRTLRAQIEGGSE